VSFRFRDGSQENGVPLADAVELVRRAIDAHALVSSAADLRPEGASA